MKAAAVLLVLAVAGLAALSVASCSVHRLSDGYTCDPNGNGNDCGSDRFCDRGFCVEGGSTDLCPPQCTSCDVGDRSCQINCTAGQPCGDVHCPAGYDCTIRCNNSQACGDIDCAQALSCDVQCSGASACGSVHCGAGECAIRCSGTLACPTIDCAASCGCDVSCTNSTACPSMACPMRALGPCTDQGSVGAPCSSDPAGCDLCF